MQRLKAAVAHGKWQVGLVWAHCVDKFGVSFLLRLESDHGTTACAQKWPVGRITEWVCTNVGNTCLSLKLQSPEKYLDGRQVYGPQFYCCLPHQQNSMSGRSGP